MAAALAPFNTSMLSISLGLMSPIRLVGWPWGLSLPAPVDFVITSTPDWLASLLIITPSITYNGCVLPVSVDVPRRLTLTPPPGAPVLRRTFTPANCPLNA